MSMVELGRLDWPRADLRIGDAAYSRVHIWGDGITYHAEDVNGNAIGSLTVRFDQDQCRTVERLDAKTIQMTGDDGAVWFITKAGCNCGG